MYNTVNGAVCNRLRRWETLEINKFDARERERERGERDRDIERDRER